MHPKEGTERTTGTGVRDGNERKKKYGTTVYFSKGALRWGSTNESV